MKRALEVTDGSAENDSKASDSESADDTSLGQRASKNRERNREHAKKTRLRKKEMIEGMKIRLLDLQKEVKQQSLCQTCILGVYKFSSNHRVSNLSKIIVGVGFLFSDSSAPTELNRISFQTS